MLLSRKLISCIFLIASIGLYTTAYAKKTPSCPAVSSVKNTTLTRVLNIDGDKIVEGDFFDKYPWTVVMICFSGHDRIETIAIAQEYLSKVNKRIDGKKAEFDDEMLTWDCLYTFPDHVDDECAFFVGAYTPDSNIKD